MSEGISLWLFSTQQLSSHMIPQIVGCAVLVQTNRKDQTLLLVPWILVHGD
uniref:Uncharacterized protein n=1 Tax=Arundo donax TaxID=35708 RepID=A0A0A8YPE0_ARUDO